MVKKRFLYDSSHTSTLVVRVNAGWYVSKRTSTGAGVHSVFVPDPKLHSDIKPEDFRGDGEHAVDEGDQL